MIGHRICVPCNDSVDLFVKNSTDLEQDMVRTVLEHPACYRSNPSHLTLIELPDV